MSEYIRIDKRFHGPPASGNGGYTCGLIARHLDTPAAVRLRVPPPLDTDMRLQETPDGLLLSMGETLVASARETSIDIELPASPGFVAAQAASRRYRGFKSHFYPGCFVCGPQRGEGDGLRIFAGPLDADGMPAGMVAAAWVPDACLADASGNVATEFIWAALDCPGAYAFAEPEQGTILLGELAVSILRPVKPGQQCVLTGWEIDQSGRKHFTGTALYDAAGECLAAGQATWFEVPGVPN